MNSNYPRESSNSLPGSLTFPSHETTDIQMIDTASPDTPSAGDCSLVKCKSTKLSSTEQLDDEIDNPRDATLTTECSDGPGCYVPWLKPSSNAKLVPEKPKKRKVIKSMRSKRILRSRKSLIKKRAKGPKRAYRKKALRFFKASAKTNVRDQAKKQDQTGAPEKSGDADREPMIATELAPPFFGSS